MTTARKLLPTLAILLISCGSDDSTGPENQPPYFIEPPAAIAEVQDEVQNGGNLRDNTGILPDVSIGSIVSFYG